MHTSQTQQRLAFTLFCLVLVLTVYVGVITACEFHINIAAVVLHSELFLFYLEN